MSYASALAFITAATKNLTKENFNALGDPLVPAGTKFMADAWGRRLVNARVETLISEDEDLTITRVRGVVTEMGNLGFIFMVNLAATLEIIPLNAVPSLLASFIEVFSSKEPSEAACIQVIKMKEDGAFNQMEYSMNVEGLATGSASIRLMALVVARYFDVPCFVADAEEIYATVMGV
jgi:hypothetical protein